MVRIILILLCSILSYAFAESKVLHVSTIPSNADIYIGEVNPNHAKNPAYVSPAFINIADDTLENEILISLFNPGFTDTTLKVKLSAKDTSFIIISQQPVFDNNFLDKQQSQLSKRKRANFGKGLMKVSLIPFAVGLVSSAVAYYEIEQAKDCKKTIKNTSIETDRTQETRDDFRNYRSKAKTAKGFTYAGFLTGATLLSIGFILSF